MINQQPSVTDIQLRDLEAHLRIGGYVLLGGKLVMWTRFGKSGWRGILAAVVYLALASSAIGLTWFVDGGMFVFAVCAAVGFIGAFVVWGTEYVFSFGSGVLYRHSVFCGFRGRPEELVGPGTTYVLGPPTVYNSETGLWTQYKPEALALAAVGVVPSGEVQRIAVMYGVNSRQSKMLQEIAESLNLRNLVAQERASPARAELTATDSAA